MRIPRSYSSRWPTLDSPYWTYVALLHQWKSDSVLISDEWQDILIGTRLLGQELVAGKRNDSESAALVLLVEEFEILVLRRESTMGCCVHDEQHVALVFWKGAWMSRDTEKHNNSIPTRSLRNRRSFFSLERKNWIHPSPCHSSTNRLNSFDKN